MFTNLTNKIREFTPKQMVIAGVFTLALAGSIGLGLANKQSADAQTIRDCSKNSINYQDRNGGCGALSPSELIKDIKDNKPSDLKTIYADPQVGALTSGKYDRFAKEARRGVIKKNGDVVVDGQVVMRDAWTMGRTTLGGAQRTPIKMGSKTYYHSHPSASFGQSELDVMVMFDKNGTVEVAVMEACGNPITKGKKVKSGAKCEALNKKAVKGKENTYAFTTDTSKFGLAKIAKVEYFVDGKKIATEKDPKKPVEYTFTKTATVTAKVYADVPGKQQIVSTADCKRKITVEQKKEIFYICEQLIATARDNTNRNFRFTVNTDQSEGVMVKEVDFTIDGQVTTTGVTTKDDEGNIYKDYDFSDNVEHTVSALVHFTHEGKALTAKEACVAKVTPTQPPVCPHNPELPPEHPDCLPPQPPEEPPEEPELPNTGPASLLGLFGGASIAGGAAHKLLLRYRSRD